MFKDLGYTLRTPVSEQSTMDKVENLNCFHLIMPIHCHLEMVCGQYIPSLINQDSIEESDKMSQFKRTKLSLENE